MDSDQQQQKGLFTFYREQADFEDEIKSKKRLLKALKLQNIDESQKKLLTHEPKSKGDQVGNKKNLPSLSVNNQLSYKVEKAANDAKHKPSATKDKLISILQKYNNKQLKRRDHIRVIMEMQEEPPLDQTEQLKSRLEILLADEQRDYFKLIQSEKVINQQEAKQEPFMKKKQDIQKVNPFQRLAIIPTNFTTQLEEQKHTKLPLKKVPSPPKSLAYSLQVRKNDRIEANIQQKDRYDARLRQILPNQPLKLNLPKIDARSNSQMINKSKIRPIKLGEKYFFEPIRSERFRNKSELSMFLDNIKVCNEGSNSKHVQNKIYSLFIENKQYKGKQQSNSIDKEIHLADVVRRMKFS